MAFTTGCSNYGFCKTFSTIYQGCFHNLGIRKGQQNTFGDTIRHLVSFQAFLKSRRCYEDF